MGRNTRVAPWCCCTVPSHVTTQQLSVSCLQASVKAEAHLKIADQGEQPDVRRVQRERRPSRRQPPRVGKSRGGQSHAQPASS